MRREYVGAARKARLAAPLGGTALDLGILGDDLTGWPTGTEPFFIVIDRGQATEEKILCELRSSNSLTVYTDGVINGRGADGTPISEHQVGAYLEHVFTATDADEANEHVNSTANVHGVTSDVVGEDDAQTLTNKSMSGTANTFTNIAQASVVGLVSKLALLDAEDVDLQNQIDALEAGKADSASPTFTGTVVLPADTSIGNVSAAEIAHVDGVTANIQTQLNEKAPIDSPTFTGDVAFTGTFGGVSDAELLYLDGLTSNIQSQLNALGASIGTPTYREAVITFAQPGVLEVGQGTHRFRFPFAATIEGVSLACAVAPTGFGIIVDVNVNGTTIFTDQNERPQIAIGLYDNDESDSTIATGDGDVVVGDYITVDIDSVGSTIEGEDLTVMVRYRY